MSTELQDLKAPINEEQVIEREKEPNATDRESLTDANDPK